MRRSLVLQVHQRIVYLEKLVYSLIVGIKLKNLLQLNKYFHSDCFYDQYWYYLLLYAVYCSSTFEY
jgi:hypothetical protein